MIMRSLMLVALPTLLFLGASPLVADSAADFRQGIELLASSAGNAVQTAQALQALERVAIDYERQAGADYRLWYEAGNARWWGDKPALAIRDYRQYLARDPFRTEVWENLAQARLKAHTQAPGGEGIGDWPWSVWFLHSLAVLAGLAILALGLWCLRRRRPWLRLAVALGSLALVSGLGVAVSRAVPVHLGVIVSDTQGRKGDGAVYAPQPAQPWKAGQEALITETRSGWVRLEIAGGVSWVPASAVETLGTPAP